VWETGFPFPSSISLLVSFLGVMVGEKGKRLLALLMIEPPSMLFYRSLYILVLRHTICVCLCVCNVSSRGGRNEMVLIFGTFTRKVR